MFYLQSVTLLYDFNYLKPLQHVTLKATRQNTEQLERKLEPIILRDIVDFFFTYQLAWLQFLKEKVNWFSQLSLASMKVT